MTESYYTPADDGHKKREKEKSRQLRNGIWWKQVLGKGVCYHCEEKFNSKDLTMDHLIPISRGGKSDKKNCVPSCKACNTKKGSKTRAELALEQLTELDKKTNSKGDPA